MSDFKEGQLPIVALIGKPNVGKSTLFNRCIGRRMAITSKVAGTTRDRIFGVTNWRDVSFYLVDNAGIEYKKSNDIILEEVEKQIDYSLEEAELFIFVIDGRKPLDQDDYSIAEKLRKSKRDVIVVVNKCEGKTSTHAISEYFKLGLGTPIAVSSIHGLGVADMLDDIRDFINKNGKSVTHINKRNPRIAVVGRPNVGKSTLVNQLVGADRVVISDVPGTTRDTIDAIMQIDKNWFTISDTAGIRRRGRIAPGIEKYSVMRTTEAMKKSDLVLIVVDAKDGPVRGDVHIITAALEMGKEVLLVINKSDIVHPDYFRIEKFPFMAKLPRVFISAKTGENIRELVKKIIETILELHTRSFE